MKTLFPVTNFGKNKILGTDEKGNIVGKDPENITKKLVPGEYTIFWNGDITGRTGVEVGDVVFYKISEAIPSDILNGSTLELTWEDPEEGEMIETSDLSVKEENRIGYQVVAIDIVDETMMFNINKVGEYESIDWPETGLYALDPRGSSEAEFSYTIDYTIPEGYVTKLDPDIIPIIFNNQYEGNETYLRTLYFGGERYVLSNEVCLHKFKYTWSETAGSGIQTIITLNFIGYSPVDTAITDVSLLKALTTRVFVNGSFEKVATSSDSTLSPVTSAEFSGTGTAMNVSYLKFVNDSVTGLDFGVTTFTTTSSGTEGLQDIVVKIN